MVGVLFCVLGQAVTDGEGRTTEQKEKDNDEEKDEKKKAGFLKFPNVPAEAVLAFGLGLALGRRALPFELFL